VERDQISPAVLSGASAQTSLAGHVGGSAKATAGRPTRVALVTGASSGIGAAFARELDRRGYAVILVARDRRRLEAMAGDLTGPAEILPADLTKADERAAVEHRLADSGRPVDLLVNNAAAGQYGRVTEAKAESLAAAIDLNVLAVVQLTRAALPGMLSRHRGGILNVSSVVSTKTARGMATYAATKAFVDSWTRSLHVELEGTPVVVSCVRPGWTRSDFHRRAGQAVGDVPDELWHGPDVVARVALDAHATGRLFCAPRLPAAVEARVLAGKIRRRGLREVERLTSAVWPS
jgi:short-subunit dehydrogenase